MSSSATKSAPCLGFLTVVENAELGLLGGYLLLNAAGRPLEFHCTAPVKPNRTQEILYGPTLKPFLCGEQIGQTLLGKSKLNPAVICTDREAVLAVQEFVATPVVLVADSRQECLPNAVRSFWPAQAEHLDLLEPFVRIREALDEAQKTARQAA